MKHSRVSGTKNMDFESPDVERDFPGLYASESGRKSNESDFSDDAHERHSKKDLLMGKRKEKKDSKKDRGYAALEGESSPEEDTDIKSPSKSKKSKSFKFSSRKEKREKSREKEVKEKEKEKEKEKDNEKKKEKEAKAKLKLKERKKSKHGDDFNFEEDQPIFNVPLNLAVERSRCHDGAEIPLVVRHCIDYIQEHALRMENIYKLSGIKSKVQNLRRMYNHREKVLLDDFEPPVVTSLLKLFLRELPEPLLTTDLLTRFEEAAAIKDVTTRQAELATLVNLLPKYNRQLLGWLVLHLDYVTRYENTNKMDAQSLAMTFSPVVQMSHRLITALLCHCRALFPDIKLSKYVPPLSPTCTTLPTTPTKIVEELRKQESLLNQIHEEMNAGYVSKRKEEELWEVQRFVTQLKRKLRTMQRNSEIEQSRKSPEEDAAGSKSCDDEFHVDLTLQRVGSKSEDETETVKTIMSVTATTTSAVMTFSTVTTTAPLTVIGTSSTNLGKAFTASSTTSKSIDSVDFPEQKPKEEQFVLKSAPVVPRMQTEEKVEAVEVHKEKEKKIPSGSSTDESGDAVADVEEEVLPVMSHRETALYLENKELLKLYSTLRARIDTERSEVKKLRTEITDYPVGYDYESFRNDSSDDGSSSPSLSDISDTDDPEEASRILELRHENRLLQDKKESLIKQIADERLACLRLRVQLKMLQLSQESKQV